MWFTFADIKKVVDRTLYGGMPSAKQELTCGLLDFCEHVPNARALCDLYLLQW